MFNCFKKKKISTIHQEPTKKYNKYTATDHQKYIKNLDYEILECNFCKEKFKLNSYQIKINCGSCNKFYHCNIAGKCIGPNCSIISDNNEKIYSHYCLNCVNTKLDINIDDSDNCLCNECFNDPKTPESYKYSDY